MKSHRFKFFSSPDNTKQYSPAYSRVLQKDEGSTGTRNHVVHEWMYILWPLILHCVLSVCTMLYVVYYISDNYFNVSERTALKQNAGGFQLPFTPTQSDVITVLSSLIVTQKWALTAWMVPLCWRVAVLLMERHGLRRQDLKGLIKHRLLTPRTYFMNIPTFIIGTLLLAGLAANLASPVLTGSISWTQRNITVDSVPKPLTFKEAGTRISDSLLDEYFKDSKNHPVTAVQMAASLAGIAWRRDAEEGIYKRISRSLEPIPTDSVIESITLPYFKVESINWIVDSKDIPSTYPDAYTAFIDSFSDGPSVIHAFTTGTAVLSRNYSNPTTWRNDRMKPKKITEKRLLVLWFGFTARNLTTGLSSNAYVSIGGPAPTSGNYYAYAWVTFTAGAGRCEHYQCIISSPSVIQNSNPSPIIPEEHPLTFQAFHMVPAVTALLAMQNSTLPSLLDVDTYVEQLLIRSYSAAWSALMNSLAKSPANLSYRTPVPSLVADVNEPRVYSWLGIQLSITFLSIIFIILQSWLSVIPLIGDTSLTSFYLDTTSLPESKSVHPLINGALVVQEDGDRLKIRVD
ncbi:hypothetical protein RHS04_07232 [Rhizoctonia solani]|uniref:Transmembrane protein n=1 Tax=Rhizoctonia solani TaxID=456999 RepID=A0A8H7H5E9_9AGAM|nr:hypothetical protein RHS04_07232 [Rhizoctonia solani]